MYSNAYVWSRVLSYLEQHSPSMAVASFFGKPNPHGFVKVLFACLSHITHTAILLRTKRRTKNSGRNHA